MEEENDWKVSNQDKKNRKKRFLRQVIVFLISIIVIGIAVIIGLKFFYNKPEEVKENKPVAENKLEETNTVEDEDVEKASLQEEKYSIENKDFYFEGYEDSESPAVTIYEYDNTKSEYAELYFCLNEYSTEESYKYVIEAKNEDGESLLLNDRANAVSQRNVIGGMISPIKIDKEKVASKINITVKEMIEHSSNTRTVEREGKVTLDLAKDLEEQEKVDFESSTSSYELEDIKFETYKDDNVSKDSSRYYSENCKGVSYSIGISTQYGNKIVSEENISFYAVNNINELSLDDAFNIKTQIEEKVGQYGLSDLYEVYVTNGRGEITGEYEITFEDMKALVEGKDVSAKGKKITAQDISNNEDGLKMGESSKVKLAENIPAIKYTYKTDASITNYMFVYNGYIYYISVPSAERYETNVNLFLDSLTQK